VEEAWAPLAACLDPVELCLDFLEPSDGVPLQLLSVDTIQSSSSFLSRSRISSS
jgi:hypothetical protein